MLINAMKKWWQGLDKGALVVVGIAVVLMLGLLGIMDYKAALNDRAHAQHTAACNAQCKAAQDVLECVAENWSPRIISLVCGRPKNNE